MTTRPGDQVDQITPGRRVSPDVNPHEINPDEISPDGAVDETGQTDRPEGSADREDATSGQPPARPRSRSRFPRWGWVLLGVLIAVLLGLAGLAQVARALENNAGYDPRSSRVRGTAALAQLLRDEGVDLVTTGDVSSASSSVSTSGSTLVIVSARLLTDDEVSALLAARPREIVLIAPTSSDLIRLPLTGVRPGVPFSDRLDPGCDDAAATRSGVVFPTGTPVYSVPTGATGCYPTGEGSLMVRSQFSGVRVTILPNVVSNETLPVEGNAALAMNVLGQQPRLVWLMAQSSTAAGETGETAAGEPTLLPSWWPMLVLQLIIGLIAVGLWRGRRLGPIIYERLPVKITSAETIEGHGRLYQRQQARGAAAAALRQAAVRRLAVRHGHLGDPHVLAEVLSARMGRPPVATRLLLAGPEPVTDEQLLDLKIDLDTLEQEARHP